MSKSTVAIVGSGIAATAIAYTLARRGYDVTLFEKGPEYPYPHDVQFRKRIKHLYHDPAYELPSDLKGLTLSGDYQNDVNLERGMVVGGSATHWAAITLRMNPQDFRTRSLYGFGEDWPLTYDALEPYYCRAESLLGVSGTDADNPFAAPRSRPYPLPPFELSYDDILFARRLRKHGIRLHTTPQARTRTPYDKRPACANYGTCWVCPIGARYSPNHHLLRAKETGLCKVLPNMSVRRIVVDKSGKARTIVYQPNDSVSEKEHAAKLIIVAAGAIESARLLLLSADERHPNGLGNEGGHVGQHLAFHHLWQGTIAYKEKLYAGRIGPMTGQCHQFRDPPKRGKHGGIKVEFSSHYPGYFEPVEQPMTGKEIVESLRQIPYARGIILHAESVTTLKKYVSLSDERDRFGDPLAHVQYQSADFDSATHQFASELFERFARATNGEAGSFTAADQYDSGAHHMGTCRMGRNAGDSVVDSFGRVHGSPNLFVVGASSFVGCSGAVNPTLTLVALALRTADYITAQIL